MTIEKAIEILDPLTTNEALDKLDGLSPVDNVDYLLGEIRTACVIACDVMRMFLIWKRIEEENRE